MCSCSLNKKQHTVVSAANYTHFLNELVLRNGWPTKGVNPYYQSGPLSEILTVDNLLQTASNSSGSVKSSFATNLRKFYKKPVYKKLL